MNIIEITGGLGNQMFQYALVESFRQKGIEVGCDTTYYRSGQILRTLEISRFANVQINEADDRTIEDMRGYGYNDSIIDKVRRKIRNKETKVFTENLDKGYQPDVYGLNDMLICGYWQNEKYFMNIRDKILKDYAFGTQIESSSDEKITSVLSRIRNDNSVSIHIRRKDYLDKSNNSVYGNICTERYYTDAIQEIHKRLPGAQFIVFTDDPKWVGNNPIFNGMMLANEISNGDDMTDLYLMSQCYHHIIANSSFSWWGAWLCRKEDGIVIAPSRWFNNHEQTEMIPKRWLRL